MTVPESIRQYPTPRNPFCRKELWKNQDDLQEMINMTEENWYPHTRFNIYNQPTFAKQKDNIGTNDIITP